MTYTKIVEWYMQSNVIREIVDFSLDKWMAIHCEARDEKGNQLFLRYWKGGKPITIASEEDFKKIFHIFRKYRPRTFYVTANQYYRLRVIEDTMDMRNIEKCMPTWDIDNVFQKWEATIEVAKTIVEFLYQYGIEKSAFVKWSGNGAHVHINPMAFSDEVTTKINPLDIAYATVEYVNTRLKQKYIEIAEKFKAPELKVENKMDIKRVFTCPLSLHREVDRVAICVDPEKFENFDPAWTQPETYRHYTDWRRYKEGEGDRLAEVAFETVGPCPYLGSTKRRRRKGTRPDEIIRKFLKFDV